MNILYIPRWYPNKYDQQFGVFILKHARATALFAKVAVVYPCAATDLKSTFKKEVSSEYDLLTIIVYYQKGNRILNACRYLIAFLIALKHLKQHFEKPDIIHAHVLLRTYGIAWYLSRKWRIPYVITEHWTGFVFNAFERKSIIYKHLCQYFINHAAAFSLVSKGLLKAVEKHRIKNPNTHIVPNVVDFHELKSFENNSGRIKILTVADLVERNKNISSVITVLHELESHIPDFEYHIIGGGPDQQMLEKLASEKSMLNNTVFFHGRQSNSFVLDFLPSVDFVVVNSTIETFSVFTAEAIGAGKPVIATRCGGPEFFVNEKNGRLINKENNLELKDAIDWMCKAYMHFDSNNMQREIREQFSQEQIAKQLLEFYNTSISGI
jgi:glycosyltransferase involved in cell wall biosynthesis